MMEKKEILVILSTAPAGVSESLARMLIDERLVACVSIVPVSSYYRWKGEFCKEPEHLLIAKTAPEKTGDVIAALKSHHPYEVPEIIALPVIDGHLPYLEWVHKEIS